MMLGTTIINTVVHADIVAIPLSNSSVVYLRRRNCGWALASGSYGPRTSFPTPSPKEGNPDDPPHSPCACACETDVGDAPRLCEAAGVRGCSRNFGEHTLEDARNYCRR
jgi:hypothetical protein